MTKGYYFYMSFTATKNPCFRKKQGFKRNLYFGIIILVRFDETTVKQ